MFTKADNYVLEIHRPLDDPLFSLVVSAALAVNTALKQDSDWSRPYWEMRCVLTFDPATLPGSAESRDDTVKDHSTDVHTATHDGAEPLASAGDEVWLL